MGSSKHGTTKRSHDVFNRKPGGLVRRSKAARFKGGHRCNSTTRANAKREYFLRQWAHENARAKKGRGMT